ncbi:hypothetical protein [Acinetobacter dispersus]|uniref:hypothetical protein n=1 Tax=Acinetobacter dispersus TaxID=70348 RepID=UPI00300AC444
MYDGNTVDQEILIYFYEYFHDIIKSKLKVLELFTQFVFNNIHKNKVTQTIWFFLSYFNLSKDDSKAIEYANNFIGSANLAHTYSYNKALYTNTLRAAIRVSAWDDFFYFKSQVDGKSIGNSQEFLEIFEAGEKNT